MVKSLLMNGDSSRDTRPDAPCDPAAGEVPVGSGRMFDLVAHRYDLLNRILSLGLDGSWRKRTVRALGASAGARILDVATGTADLAIRIARMIPDARVTGLDPSVKMLERGRTKVRRAGLSDRIELVEGDAQALPFADGSFDAVTVAFGIRNVPDRLRALREMARVVRAEGRVAVLELTEPSADRVTGRLAGWYVHELVPRIGGLLSGSKEYRYLQESIRVFPPPGEFSMLMERAGLRMERATPLTFGACCLFVAQPDREPR